MASFRKRGGKWQAQVRRNGFAPALKTFTKRSDAIEWARQIETKRDRNELEPDRKVLDQTKLSHIIIRYRDEAVPKKRGCRDATGLGAVDRKSRNYRFTGLSELLLHPSRAR
jgi:hypothetical protein